MSNALSSFVTGKENSLQLSSEAHIVRNEAQQVQTFQHSFIHPSIHLFI
jgi:hypothetical protein